MSNLLNALRDLFIEVTVDPEAAEWLFIEDNEELWRLSVQKANNALEFTFDGAKMHSTARSDSVLTNNALLYKSLEGFKPDQQAIRAVIATGGKSPVNSKGYPLFSDEGLTVIMTLDRMKRREPKQLHALLTALMSKV